MTFNPPDIHFPRPKRERWQPLRCGLLNIFRYDNQIFLFEDGRLLLRGSNGSGKSRVLALTLPFLFDGELDPIRMEPDRDRYKRVAWNLLMGKYQDRSGYTWIEFGRRTKEGPRFLTLGCGLDAMARGQRLERWFFITGQRVDLDFSLQTETGQVLTRKRLEEALAGEGEIFTIARNYRRAVNNRLFQLNDHRYGALINLLIELRQPQVSRRLDEEKLSRALSEALPPLPESVIDNVAEAFRGLDQDRDELHRLELAAAGIERFLRSYRTYLRVAARRRAERVRSKHHHYEEFGRKLKAAGIEKERAYTRARAAETELDQLEVERDETRVRIETLDDSPEMLKARDLDRAKEYAEQSLAHEREAKEKAQESQNRLEEMKGRGQQARTRAESTRSEVEQVSTRCEMAAQQSTLAEPYQRTRQNLSLPDVRNPAEIQAFGATLKQNIAGRRRDIEHLAKRNRELRTATQHLARAKDSYTELCSQLNDAEEIFQATHQGRTKETNKLTLAGRQWLAELVELPAGDPREMQRVFKSGARTPRVKARWKSRRGPHAIARPIKLPPKKITSKAS